MKNKMKFVFVVLSILIIISLWLSIYNFNNMPEKVCVDNITTEIINISFGDIITYPYEYEIMCEEGIDVEEYEPLNEKIIFSCMRLGNHKCIGEGKICIIKKTEQVCTWK